MPLVEIADFNRDGLFDLAYARPETQEIVSDGATSVIEQKFIGRQQ